MKKRLSAAVLAASVALSEVGAVPALDALTAHAEGWVVNAADFGINGKDKLNDREGIENALKKGRNATADNPLTVEIPSGTYYIATPLRIYSHTTLKLQPDTIIKRMDDNQYMLSYEGANNNTSGYNEITDVTIEGGVWDGNVTNTKNAKGLVLFRNTNHITFKDTAFKNVCGTHYMLVGGVSDMTFDNVTFSDFKAFTGTEAQYRKATGDAGFKYRTAEVIHTDFINGTPCKNILVQNCTFDGITTGVGTHHTSSNRAKNITVKNNTFKNCYFYAVNAASFDGLTVTGNTMTNCGGLVYTEDSSGTVSNNSLSARSASGSWYTHDVTPLDGIHALDGSTLTVSNNTLKSCSGYGIYAQSSKLTGSGNTVSASKGKTGGSAPSSLLSAGSGSDTSSKTALKASDFTISAKFAYKGSQIRPAVKSSLTKGSDFTVTYGANKNVGQGIVTIKGKGRYNGTVTKTFKIVPAKQTVTVTKTATGAKVSWKKDTAATKYYLRYSTTPSFAKYSTKAYSSTRTSASFKIPAGKTYYVKVLTYTKIGGVVYQGSWSAVQQMSRK